MSNQEINKNFPLPITCKELGELFKEWETQNIFVNYPDEDFFYFRPWHEHSKTSVVCPAPTFQELWDKLPKELKNKLTYYLKLDNEDIGFYSYSHEDYLFYTEIDNSHVVESMAQLLIKLKKEGLV